MATVVRWQRRRATAEEVGGGARAGDCCGTREAQGWAAGGRVELEVLSAGAELAESAAALQRLAGEDDCSGEGETTH